MSIIDENLQESPQQSQPIFSAILTPYRSLSPKGFFILMVFLGGISFIIGIGFFMHGAWPVFGFLGLEFLLIYIAFRVNYRAGKVFETVEIFQDELVVQRCFPSGKVNHWSFNPYWVKVIVEETSDESVRLLLSSHEQKLEIGTFLLSYEKADFADALKDALFEYRGGTRI